MWPTRAYLVSYTAGQILPTAIGGDAVRIFETSGGIPGAGRHHRHRPARTRPGRGRTVLLGAVGFVLAIGRYHVGAYLWLEGRSSYARGGGGGGWPGLRPRQGASIASSRSRAWRLISHGCAGGVYRVLPPTTRLTKLAAERKHPSAARARVVAERRSTQKRDEAADAPCRAAAGRGARRRGRGAGCAEDECLQPEVGADVVMADREHEPDRAEEDGARAPEPPLDHDDGGRGRRSARGAAWPSRRSARRRRRSRSAGSGRRCRRRSTPASATRTVVEIRWAASSHCHRSAIGSAVRVMIATESANHQGSADLRTSHVWWMSILSRRPDRERGQREADEDPHRALDVRQLRDARRLDPRNRPCTRRTASTASRMSSSECAGESGSERPRPRPLRHRQRRLPGVTVAEPRQPVHRQEVDARRDQLLGQRALVVVPARAGFEASMRMM